MILRTSSTRLGSLAAVLLVWTLVSSSLRGAEILIADRLTNSVYRYSPSGSFLGVLLTDNVNLNQPAGIQVSPDRTKLYVASSQNNQVVQYDYNFAAGTATNPMVFASAAAGLSFPSSIAFNPAGDRVYISNLGGTGVAQLNLDKTLAGPALNGLVGGGQIFQYSGLAFAPDGALLVGGFQNLAGTEGAVAKSDALLSTLSDFVAPTAALNGAGQLIVKGNTAYVTAGFAGRVNAYNATTGAVDGSFAPLTGLLFPASIALSPDGNSLLVGSLGFAAGTGNISRYSLSGDLLGLVASASSDPALGFFEATAMVTVPEPGMLPMALAAMSFIGWQVARRRAARRDL